MLWTVYGCVQCDIFHNYSPVTGKFSSQKVDFTEYTVDTSNTIQGFVSFKIIVETHE